MAELIEIQKRRRNKEGDPEGEPDVYELHFNHYIEVQSTRSANSYWQVKDKYELCEDDVVLQEYPDGVWVVGVGYFENRDTFIDMMKKHFNAVVLCSVSE